MGSAPVRFAIVSLGLLALYLGWRGANSLNPNDSILDSLYKAVKLFVLEDSGMFRLEHPLTLEIARWLAPITTISSIFAAASTYLKQLSDFIRLLFCSDHTIVLGASDEALHLIADLSTSKKGKIVVVERNASAPNLQELKKYRALVIIGDFESKANLEKARVYKAKSVISLTSKNEKNLSVILRASQLIPDSRFENPVKFYLPIKGFFHTESLQSSGICDYPGATKKKIIVVNLVRNRARCLFSKHPIEVDRLGKVKEPLIIFDTYNDLVQAFIVHTAEVGHFPYDVKATIYIVSTDAEIRVEKLANHFPAVKECVNLHSVQLKSGDDSVDTIVRLIESKEGNYNKSVFLMESSPPSEMIEAIRIKERITVDASVTFVIPELDNGLLPKGIDCIKSVETLEDSLSGAAVFMASLEDSAKKLHEAWYNQNDMLIKTAENDGMFEKASALKSKPAFLPWEDLSDEQRKPSISLADHAEIKKRFIMSETGQKEGSSINAKLVDESVMEALCRMEHNRWMSTLKMMGWNYGSKRNDDKKIHNNLVPYDELDADAKSFDNTMIDNLQ